MRFANSCNLFGQVSVGKIGYCTAKIKGNVILQTQHATSFGLKANERKI